MDRTRPTEQLDRQARLAARLQAALLMVLLGAHAFPAHGMAVAVLGLVPLIQLLPAAASRGASAGDAAVIGLALLAAAGRPDAPGAALLTLCFAAGVVAWARGRLRMSGEPGPATVTAPVAVAALASLALARTGGLDAWWVPALLASPVAMAAAADALAGRLPRVRAWVLGLSWALALSSAAMPTFAPATLVPLFALVLARATPVVDALVTTPARLLVSSFVVLCAAGTALLTLPQSAVGQPLTVLEAAFTSVSAACVTGLAVVDTATRLSFFGQLVVIVLIQCGGLGIMTFAAAAFLAIGRRLGLRQEVAATELLGADGTSDLPGALRRVLLVTLTVEGLAAAILTGLFRVGGDTWPQALWRGLFTAISAFCNAGFALQSDSLVSYAHRPLVLTTVGLVIVLGGLGPSLVVSLPRLARGRAPLAARLAWRTSVVLWALPFMLWLALEGPHSLAGLPLGDRVVNAAFQAVTLRTAGFNSVDLAVAHPGTWLAMLACMFVGGAPGSTAGGVKTTTVAVLAVAIAAALRGRSEAEAFGRRLAHATVLQAAAILSLYVLAALLFLLALLVTQELPVTVAVFEVVSALGTVGLSQGGTAQLDEIGQVLIIAAMFVGRVGPVSLGAVLAGTPTEDHLARSPLARVPVG